MRPIILLASALIAAGPASAYENDGAPGLYGYIDRSGRTVIAPRFESAGEFSEGLASVRVGDRWGYIDKNGVFAIPAVFDEAFGFSGGLARVEKDGKWGFIDPSGKWAIPPLYEAAGDFRRGSANAASFSEGLAAVRVGGLWGYIDTRGKLVVAPKFFDAMDFSEGLAAVRAPKEPMLAARPPQPEAVRPPSITPSEREAAKAAYLKGIVCYQKGEYLCARSQWRITKALDPDHASVDDWLKRLDDWGY